MALLRWFWSYLLHSVQKSISTLLAKQQQSRINKTFAKKFPIFSDFFIFSDDHFDILRFFYSWIFHQLKSFSQIPVAWIWMQSVADNFIVNINLIFVLCISANPSFEHFITSKFHFEILCVDFIPNRNFRWLLKYFLVGERQIVRRFVLHTNIICCG